MKQMSLCLIMIFSLKVKVWQERDTQNNYSLPFVLSIIVDSCEIFPRIFRPLSVPSGPNGTVNLSLTNSNIASVRITLQTDT